ncbi:Mbeg1-like protein [Fusobacterium sp.]|uniref:Mbeg1-like protein n=1 Tax=Fusobacterium sp. TaxID=68766 RepID=UPI0025C372E6|nr:Mbeg1-like protein [Fusobacterium sp.]
MMIKDVEYAFFAQLSYLNWNNLDLNKLKDHDEYNDKEFIKFLNLSDVWNEIKRKDTIEPRVENGILMYDEADKRLFGVFGIVRNKENPKLMNPYYDFNGWQFIYSADKTKLYRDKYKFEDVEDDGFYAVAFMKDENIVIAYRGTEPEQLKDLLTDLDIGFLNRSHSQLVSAYLFAEYVKELYPNKKIHLTGHSLGGCLTQYVYVCTNKKYPTVTWNALGLGKHKNKITDGIFWGNDITDYIGLYSLQMQCELEEKVLEKNGNIKDKIILSSEKENIDSIFNVLNPRATEIYEKGKYTVIEKDGFSLSFVDSNSVGRNREERNNLTSEQRKQLEKELKIKSIEIYWLLRGIRNYQLSFEVQSENIKNYYNSKDWTALLQTREGNIIDVLTGEVGKQEPINDTKTRVIKETIDKFGFTYHSVNDFLMYMNKEGMIEVGKYNEIFTKNLIKTIYQYIKPTNNCLKLEIFKESSTKYTDKEKPFERFHTLAKKERVFLRNLTLIEEAKIKYLTPSINVLSSDVNDYIHYTPFTFKLDKNDEEGVYVIGQLSNVTLAGIKGGVESQLIQIKERKKKEETKGLKLSNQNNEKYYQNFSTKGGFKFNGRGEYCN